MTPQAEKFTTHLIELAQAGDPEEVLNDALLALAAVACLLSGDEEPKTFVRVQRSLAHTLAATLDGEVA